MDRLTPTTLRPCIREILSERPSRASIRAYVGLVHALAQASIKTSRFHRQSDLGIHSRSDLALDAVADLFERDCSGRFTQLIRYFESREWAQLDDRELWTVNRKLVAGAVADSYFRNYRLADPSLARIIRNTKRGVQHMQELTLERSSGRLSVCVQKQEKRDGREWDLSTLTATLVPAARNSLSIPDVLRHAANVLAHAEHYTNYVRLSTLALAIRECSVVLNRQSLDSLDDSLLTPEEVDRAVDEALQRAFDPKRQFYVSKGKLTSSEFELMRSSIELRLRNELGQSVSGETNFEAFSAYFDGISNEVYRERYRNAFEYLFRLSHTALSDIVQEWIGESAA